MYNVHFTIMYKVHAPLLIFPQCNTIIILQNNISFLSDNIDLNLKVFLSVFIPMLEGLKKNENKITHPLYNIEVTLCDLSVNFRSCFIS